jgi:transcriptional regulator with XRE-family HTH domain
LGVRDWKLAGDPHQSLPTIPQPLTLQWNIQALAHAHGIARVADLARFLGLPRQGLYAVWRGTAVNVSVARLERFAQRLGPTSEDWLRPGDWFRWGNRRRLTWAVRDVAEQVGLDATQLAFAANQYPQQLELYWTGEAKFVFVETLAQLATALETADRAFDVGELFRRAEGQGPRAGESYVSQPSALGPQPFKEPL